MLPRMYDVYTKLYCSVILILHREDSQMYKDLTRKLHLQILNQRQVIRLPEIEGVIQYLTILTGKEHLQ